MFYFSKIALIHIDILTTFTEKMKIVKIPFSGITRNTDDGICPDGECMELINARIENGSIEPVSKPIVIASLSGSYKEIYYHPLTGKYIAIVASDGSLAEMDKTFQVLGYLSPDVKGTTKVEFIGNVMCAITGNGIKYFIHRNDVYVYLGILPSLPEITITKKMGSEIVASDVNLQYGRNASESQRKAFYEASYGYYLKAIKQLNERGYFSHSTFVRIALRMYDGSYIKHSPIRCICLNSSDELSVRVPGGYDGKMNFFGGDTENTYWSEKDTLDPQIFHFGCMGFKPDFSYDSFNLEDWSDLIVSIDIFALQSIRGNLRMTGDFDKTSPVYETMCNVSRFYKIASIDLKGNLSYPKMDVSADYFSLCEQLTDDAYTHNNISAKNSYVYNSRLHIHGITSDIFQGFEKDYLYDSSTGSTGTGNIQVFTYIRTNNGDCVVGKTFNGISIPETITPYFMYPDSRAYRMVIKVSSGTLFKVKDLELKKHPSLNLSCFINNIKKSNRVDGGRFDFYTADDAVPFSIELWDDIDIPVTLNSIMESDNMKLKVSSLNNPFYFPAKSTYQFQGDIIALQSNTTALSQGQFGQHPLYVFCAQGVFAMQVGIDGSVAYTSSVPLSRDACVSPYICGIDSAVAFLTDRGAMLISGTTIQSFSESIDGFLPSCVLSSPVIPKILGIASLDGNISSAVFKDYITGSKIGYNYQRSEIIIANPEYSYSYVYSMKSTKWHKISLQISNFVNAYPDTYVIVQEDKSSRLYDLNNNHRSIATMALLTRPIKMGTNAHKRILQTALRGIVKRALSDLYLRGEPVMFRSESLDIFSDVGFYILGSNDAEHFSLVSGKESMLDIRDLVTKMNKSKAYKYFMVALVGGVRSDVSLNYIEVIADQSFDNRLR